MNRAQQIGEQLAELQIERMDVRERLLEANTTLAAIETQVSTLISELESGADLFGDVDVGV